MGLILEGKRSGVIKEVRLAIEAVRRAGLYVSDRLFEESLRLAGE